MVFIFIATLVSNNISNYLNSLLLITLVQYLLTYVFKNFMSYSSGIILSVTDTVELIYLTA